MKILLYTHCWLWFNASPERFRARTRRLLENRSTELYLSVASAWEIGIKSALGKLTLPAPVVDYVPSRLRDAGIDPLSIELRHVLEASTLPPLHRDPFDRMLVAQARLEGMKLLTADDQLARYDVDRIDA